MKKIVITLTLAMFFVAFANAQDYKTGIGVRLGWDQGLTIKHFINAKTALEGILSYRWGGLDITGLYEVHNSIGEIDRLRWLVGGGAHVGFYGSHYAGGEVTAVGIVGILGLDYSFSDIPINLTLDWKPVFDIVGYSHFFPEGGALSIRYTF